MAILNFTEPSGSNMACRHVRVCWFPKRNVKLQLVRVTWSRILTGNLAKSSDTCWSPITVWDAPKSTMPVVPEVANNTSLHEGSGLWPFDAAKVKSDAGTGGLSVWPVSEDVFILRHFFHWVWNRLASLCTWSGISLVILFPPFYHYPNYGWFRNNLQHHTCPESRKRPNWWNQWADLRQSQRRQEHGWRHCLHSGSK